MSPLRDLLFAALGIGTGLALGWVVFPAVLYESVPQPMSFNHAVHTGEDVGMACETCHVSGGDGLFTGVPPVSTCAECHLEPLGESAEEKRLVEEFIAKGREIPWLVHSRQPDNVIFPHETHVSLAGLSCAECHGEYGASTTTEPFERNRISGYSRAIWGPAMLKLGREPGKGMKMTDCSECHRGRDVNESCMDCHR